jgi:type VI secretion system ImpM family protein
MTRAGSTTIGILGKAPWRDEYLRIGVEGEPFASFDTWLTDNVEWAAIHAGPAFADAYRQGSARAFVFRPNGTRAPVLAGAMVPSHDGAGRNFPLIVAAPFADQAEELAATPELLPIVLEDFWQLANELVVAVQDAGGHDLAGRLAAVPLPPMPSASEAAATYVEWKNTMPLTDLFTLVYGESDGARVAHALRMMLAAVKPYRDVDRPVCRDEERIRAAPTNSSTTAKRLRSVTKTSWRWSRGARAPDGRCLRKVARARAARPVGLPAARHETAR